MISLLIVLLGAPGAPCHTLEGEAFLEVLAAGDTYFEHQPIRLRLRFGFEREFLETRMIQPFRRPLDVPARLEAPWLEDLACALVQSAQPGHGPTFAIGDDVVAATAVATAVRDGREFAVVELERTLLPTCTGELSLPGATLRYAFASTFRDDVFAGRVPDDPTDGVVQGEGLTLTIRPLPREGRPLDFTGAVGRFTLSAEADRTQVVAGESFTLELTIEGEGDLSHFDPPRFAELAGFHERGRIDNPAPSARVLTLDLAASDAKVTEIPALSFSFFDPEIPGYRTARSASIPLEVSPAAGPRPGSSKAPEPRKTRRRGGSPLRILLAVVLIASAVRILARRRANRDRGPAGPAGD